MRRGLRRVCQEPFQQDHEPADRVGLLGELGAGSRDPGTEFFLQHREEEVVLTAEVLIEETQRVPRLVGHLLKGEALPSVAGARWRPG